MIFTFSTVTLRSPTFYFLDEVQHVGDHLQASLSYIAVDIYKDNAGKVRINIFNLLMLNPSNAEVTLAISTRTERFLKTA